MNALGGIQIFNTPASMLRSFPRLSLQQIKHLIESFEPDTISPSPIPYEVRNMVRLSCPYEAEPALLVPARLALDKIDDGDASRATPPYTMEDDRYTV
jgi:hypothetical protein